MTYYHVLWTRPQLKAGVGAAAQDLTLWDFELLIWLLSAVQARRHGPLRLVTDSRGALAAERAGMAPIYTDGISTALDGVPSDLNTVSFWAGGKLYAYDLVEAPCVCVDLDAVLWKPLRPVSPVMALHAEGKDWAWYKDNRRDYERFGFEDAEWNWNLDPFNTGVLYLGTAEVARRYAGTAKAFVERYSREVCANPSARPQGSNAMLFAEQRLLPMCADRLGLRVEPIVHIAPLLTCLPKNPECLHLWGTKFAYKLCPEARLAFVNWSIDFLLKNFPESGPVLARWDLDHPKQDLDRCQIEPRVFKEVHRGDLRFSLLKRVEGTIRIHDLTTGISREASQGCMVWSGEIIQPEPGARFELEVVGLESLKLQATA